MNLTEIKRLLRNVYTQHEASLPQSVAVLHVLPDEPVTCHGVNPYTNCLFRNAGSGVATIQRENKDMPIITININPTEEVNI